MRGLSVPAFYLMGALYFTYPLVTGLDRLVTDLADPLLNSWILSWDVHRLFDQPLRLFDANIFHPEKGTLAFSEHLLGIALLVAPVELLFEAPVLAHNVALLVLIALSGFTGYRLSTRVTGSKIAGFVSGSFFAFLPYRLGHLSHVQLQAAAFIPLVFLSLDRYCESARLVWLAGLALSLWWVSAACGYYGVFTWIALGIAVPWALLEKRRPALRRRLLAILAAFGVTALGLLPLARPYFRLQSEFGFSRPAERLVPASARLRSYARSSASFHQALGLRGANAEQTLFPGISLVVLSALGLFGLDRKSALYLVLGAFAFWASLGPSAGLYGLLHALVPGVNGLRVPARFAILVFLALSVLAGAGVSFLSRRLEDRRAKGLLAFLALLPLAELYGTKNIFTAAPVDVPAAESYLETAKPREAAVVHLPMPYARDRIRENAVYMLWSTVHFRPMVNGHSAFAPPSFYEAAEKLEAFPDEPSLALLKERGVGFVVLHRDRYLAERASELERRTGGEPALEKVFEDESASVYRIKAR